jgi:adenylosuccinate lyase
MPQKRNPISSEVILAQSKILRAQAGLVLDGMISDFERASGPWHLEWAAIPTAFISMVGALHQAEFALSGLQVNEDVMLRNLESTRGLIVAESVMMSLANFTGRQEAQEIVYKGCVDAHENNRPLLDSLLEIEVVVKHIALEDLQNLCDPTKYMGTCQEMVDELLVSAKLPKTKGQVNGSHNGVDGHSKAANDIHKQEAHMKENGVQNCFETTNGSLI